MPARHELEHQHLGARSGGDWWHDDDQGDPGDEHREPEYLEPCDTCVEVDGCDDPAACTCSCHRGGSRGR